MTISLRIPSNLRKHVDGSLAIDVQGATVDQLLQDVAKHYPELETAIVNRTGGLHAHVQLFVNGRNIRDLKGVETSLSSTDEVLLVAPVAGG